MQAAGGAPEIYPNKQAVKMTRLSCHRFRSNEVRLWLIVMAYNLANLWRRLLLPKRVNYQLAAAVSENGLPVDQACPLLLVAVGGEPSRLAALWTHTGQDPLPGG
jgi:hypothetical protein